MRLKKAFCSGLMLGALLTCQPAWALRCGTYLVDVGMQKTEVLQRCGTPTSQEKKTERRFVRQRSGFPNQPIFIEREVFVDIEEWIYNFGPTQFMQRLVFEEGRLVKIEDLSYGR